MLYINGKNTIYDDIASKVPFTTLDDIKDPSGFLLGADMLIELDVLNRTITCTGNLTYYWRGVVKTLTSPWTSDPFDEGDGIYYLYSTDGETFTWSTIPFEFYYIQLAIVLVKDGVVIGLRESHGTQPFQTHENEHRNIGTYRLSGGIAQAGTFNYNSANNADTKPGFTSAVIKDEDLSTTITALPSGTYTKVYVNADGELAFVTDAVFPFTVNTSYIQVNNVTTGAFTDGVNNRYYNIYQILVPTMADADSTKYRMLFLQPQNTFTTLAAAQAEDTRGLSLGDLANLLPEFCIFTRITYVTASGDGNTGKVRIPVNGISYVIGTKQGQVSVNGFNPSNADNIQLTPGGNIQSDTVSQAVYELDNEKQRVVLTNRVDTIDNLQIETDTYDAYEVYGLTQAITIKNHATSTPVNNKSLFIKIKDDGTPRAITFESNYRAIQTLPTTTTASKWLYIGFIWNQTDSKFDCIATSVEP